MRILFTFGSVATISAVGSVTARGHYSTITDDMECRAFRQQDAGTGARSSTCVSTYCGERHSCRDIETHRPACLHVEATALPCTAIGVGEGKVLRHVVVVVSQFKALGASFRDVRPRTRHCRHLAPVFGFRVLRLRPRGTLLCQDGRKEGEEGQ